jgi:uncharacterized surface protein with fasciclin (FAS1) repeats
MRQRITVAAGAVAAASTAFAQCNTAPHETNASNQSQVRMVSMEAGPDIVEVAASAGQFETLLAAAKAAGLVEALKGDGPLTVFAPTDEAFAKLGDRTIRNLLREDNRDRLRAILTYHVVAGELTAKDVASSDAAVTLNGQRIEFTTDDGVKVDKANVVKADIRAENGVIHVIDSVLLPSTSNIVETAQSAGSFGTLVAAVGAADLVEALSGDGPFTVFAPTDEAFSKLPKGTVESLLKPENKDRLVEILTYHVVQGRVFSDDALSAGKATTLQGKDVRIRLRNGRLMINDSNVIANDIDTSNGVVHAIDTVLIPERPEPRPQGRKIIGVYLDEAGGGVRNALGLSRGVGLVVTRLTDGGEAEKSGVQSGDIIVEVDGKPATQRALDEAKAKRDFGDIVPLTIVRGGKRLHIDVAIGVERH